MNTIKCPHCGTEYEVEKQDMYHYTKCEVCGKGFVVGATSSLLAESSTVHSSSGNQMMARGTKPQPRGSAVPRSRPFANINKTTASQNSRQQKLGNANAVMWFSIGGACLALVIALAVAFATRSSRHGKGKTFAASEVVAHAEEVVQNDDRAPTASDVVAEEKKEDYISKLIQEADAGGVLAEVSQCELGDMPEDECKEYMAGSEYGKVEYGDVATLAKRTQGSIGLIGNVLKGRNPLELFHFGDKPTQELKEKDGNRIVQYVIQDFLGIQRMTLGYTKKGTLFSICFVSENDHYSATESDSRVSKLMQLCDEWCDGIEWELGKQEHDGRKFAIGRIKLTSDMVENGSLEKHNYRDMVFSIIPTRGERNVVGLQVNLIDKRRRRLESDYLDVDIRRPIKVLDSQYTEKKEWLREQLNSHGLREHQFFRKYECGQLYAFDYLIKKSIYTDREYVGYISIILDNGVLKVSGDLAIDEDYAEEIIIAKLMAFSKEFEGIDGEIDDYRPIGPGGDIRLPCPLCHGNKSKADACRECWNKTRKQNSGLISLSKSEFRDKFNAYKEYYRMRVAPSGWHGKPKQNRPKTQPLPPLHEEYVPTKEEAKAIAESDRRSRKLMKERQDAKGKRYRQR